ncbi:uncharacterized protein M421DRAFT_21486, partial [Didymella exigua CBS 183.55]
RLLLVPYSAHHVPTYHEWMQDEAIQKATASEPLTLEEEYAMQRSWRTDADKLTFIVCTRDADAGAGSISIIAGEQDAPSRMVGDVNLFLYDADDDDDDEDKDKAQSTPTAHTTPLKPIIGELEIMIARPSQQNQGLGLETLRAFLSYIQTQLPLLGTEYAGARGAAVQYLRVKIDKDNVRSLRLFEKLGFVKTGAGPNYFGEVEMR